MSCHPIGQEVVLHTHFVVREDAQLYGFINKRTRALFRELLKANGVGPKLALAILSGMSASQFVNVVEREEIGVLIKLPGVGKRLPSGCGRDEGSPQGLERRRPVYPLYRCRDRPTGGDSDALQRRGAGGLGAAGSGQYKLPQATSVVSKIYQPEMKAEAVIRALRSGCSGGVDP